MNKDQIIKYAAIAGGAYLVYWYVTNYGPGGHVSTGVPSYWDTWFGGASTQPQPGMTTTNPASQASTTQAVVTQPSNTTASNSHLTAEALPTSAQLRQAILNASSGNGAVSGGYATPDVWSYYYQNIVGRPISSAQLSAMFPPGTNGQGAPLTLDQFLSALPSQGLMGIGHIVNVPATNSIPSMSFGGNLRRPGVQGINRGMGGRGGPTIQ